MGSSLITCEIDLTAAGKQHGYLRVPHSTHRSAYGWLGIPITSIRNGEGPTVLFLAGVHGDEYEGQIALAKLAQSLEAEKIQGRVIILTATNMPAAQAGLRVSPIDEGNLNRAFPGDPTGTVTQMIAHYIESVLLPECDYLVDLHSGGTSLFYPPTLLRGMGHGAAEAAALRKLQEAFDLPYAWVFTSGGGRGSTARTAMGAGNRNGVVSIMAELGGGGGVSREVLQQTERGVRRILQSLGVTGGVMEPARGTRELNAKGSVFAYDAGVFEPLKDIADTVAEGEVVGFVHAVDAPEKPPREVTSPYAGIVLCKRALAQVQRGDAVFQIAQDAAGQ